MAPPKNKKPKLSATEKKEKERQKKAQQREAAKANKKDNQSAAKVKIKDMSTDEKKEYNRNMQAKSREKKNPDDKNERLIKDKEQHQRTREKELPDDKKERLNKDKEQHERTREKETPGQKKERLKKQQDRQKESRAKDPPLLNWARRFTMDNMYTFDAVENYLGPLKVWSKGEKLEHDVRWQEVMVDRWLAKLYDANKADERNRTSANPNFDENIAYFLDPTEKGFEHNGWTFFKEKCRKVKKNYWTDRLYALIQYPDLVRRAAIEGEISEDMLSFVIEERKKKNTEYTKPVFGGPVCPCFARKFFGENLQCCQTTMKKFNASTEEVVVGDQVEKVDVVDGEVESVVDFMKSNFGISSTGTFVLPE